MNGDPRFTREAFKPAVEDIPFDEGEPAHAAPQRGVAVERGESGANKFKLVRFGGSPFDPNEEWRIKHIMPMKGVGLIYGKSQSLKSFVAMHLALAVALGEAWAGKRVEKTAVVYVCAEGQGGFPKRAAGMVAARRIKGEVDFHIIYTAPNLGAMDGDLPALIAAIEAAGIKPGLVIIDTTAKVIGAAEENGPGMAAFVWNAGALSEHFGCFTLAVHHVGHGEDAQKRPRGWSGVIGAVDVQILCERDGEAFATALTVQKEKDEAAGFSLTANLSRVVLGTDRDGDEISTLVVDEVVKAEPVAKAAAPKRVLASQRLLMDCVLKAIDEAGESFHPFGVEVRGVADEHIRTRLYASIAEKAGPNEDPETLEERQRKAFNRSIAGALLAKDLVAKDHKGSRYVWLP
jgi:AAA domain-containing protein